MKHRISPTLQTIELVALTIGLVCAIALLILYATGYVANATEEAYNAGIQHAVTSDGWIEGDEFILTVDGEEYVWEIEK